MKKLFILLLTSVSVISFSQTQTASIKVKLFFIGTEENKFISERIGFSTEKKYTYCYDSETFNNLQLSGNAENLSVSVSIQADGGADKLMYFKSRIDLKGTTEFTTKDFNFQMGERYFITIFENDGNVLFKGELDSQGCM
jgi:hypothetical protein